VVVVKVVIPFSYGDPNMKFTPLPNTLHNTMTQLLGQKMITLPHIRTPYPSKLLPPRFKPNAYCHFHQQNGHDTKICKHLKHIVQDLIYVDHIFVKSAND
jgi:hypothetical protein